MAATRVEATRRIPAPAAEIWAIVSTPEGHVRVDGSGMLVSAPENQPVTAAGDTFDIEMDRRPLGDIPDMRIEPADDGACDVTNDCDWTDLDPEIRERSEGRWPIVPLSMLAESVARLEQLVVG